MKLRIYSHWTLFTEKFNKPVYGGFHDVLYPGYDIVKDRVLAKPLTLKNTWLFYTILSHVHEKSTYLDSPRYKEIRIGIQRITPLTG